MEQRKPFIFIDWDDTILPSTYLSSLDSIEIEKIRLSNKYKNLIDYSNKTGDKRYVSMNRIDDLARTLLSIINMYGRIYFVTNALLVWFYGTAKFYLPRTLEYILSTNIEVISAQEENYKRVSLSGIENNDTYTYWKYLTFKRILERDRLMHDGNIMSIGDGIYEYNAIGRIQGENLQYSVKRIKFKTFPTVDKLINELTMLTNDFKRIITDKKKIFSYEKDDTKKIEKFEDQTSNFLENVSKGYIGGMIKRENIISAKAYNEKIDLFWYCY